VFIFWSVWVVAYKFIPWYLGATLLRERNRTLLVATFLCASAGVVQWFGEATTHKAKDEGSGKASSKRRGVTTVQERLIKPEVITVLGILMLTLFVPFVGQRLLRTSAVQPPAGPKPTEINAMIWNIHFGYDNFGRNNFEDVAAAVKERKINVLGILESDMSRIITGGRDMVEFLEEHLNMYSDFGPNTAKSTWGCGLLSKFPIETVKRIILPSPEGELACLIDANIRVDDQLVNVIVTHFGNTEDQLDRQLQTKGLADIARQQTLPMIVLSYITDKPKSKNYYEILSSGLQDTTDQQNRYCEYIFYKGLNMVSFERWGGGTISDTEAQYGKWTLP